MYGTADAAVARWLSEDPGAAWIGENGTHSIVVVPLRAGGATLGLAVFGRHERPEPFQPEDLRLAEEIATRAAAWACTPRTGTTGSTPTP